VLSHQDGCRSAVALLLKAALIQVSDYRLLGASGLSVTCGRSWFSPGSPVSSTNKIDRQDITEILLKVGVKHHNPNPNMIFMITPAFSKNIIMY
jgi:hypothetical protein